MSHLRIYEAPHTSETHRTLQAPAATWRTLLERLRDPNLVPYKERPLLQTVQRQIEQLLAGAPSSAPALRLSTGLREAALIQSVARRRGMI